MDKLIFLVFFIYSFKALCIELDYKTVNAAVGNRKYFEVILDRIDILMEDTSLMESHLKIRKINNTRAIVGYAILHQPFGNEILVEGKGLKKQGGEYRYSPYAVLPINLCDGLAADTYAYPDFAKNSDFPSDIGENCPLPARNYSFHGVSFKLDKVPTNMASSGEYGCELIFYKNDGVTNTTIGTYRIFGFINYV